MIVPSASGPMRAVRAPPLQGYGMPNAPAYGTILGPRSRACTASPSVQEPFDQQFVILYTDTDPDLVTSSTRILPLPTRKAHRRLILVVALAYTLGWILPLVHHHALDLRLTPDEKISAHTCGTVEHHIPLESFHGCEICWQTSQRESLPVEWVVTGRIEAIADALHDVRTTRTHPASVLLPDKRGPPTVA